MLGLIPSRPAFSYSNIVRGRKELAVVHTPGKIDRETQTITCPITPTKVLKTNIGTLFGHF